MTFEEFFNIIIKKNEIHAKWLNSLSYLEYSGSRKIIKSQSSEALNTAALTHLLEEVKHSFYFKKLAKETGGDKFDSYSESTLLSAKAIKNYFYTLDHGTLKIIEEHGEKIESTYLLVTWLIEERALSVYQSYEDALIKNNNKISLVNILNDESRHLQVVTLGLKDNLLRWEKLKIHLKHFENKCFTNLWDTLVNEIEALEGEKIKL